jgi:FkbM family methyltransferase
MSPTAEASASARRQAYRIAKQALDRLPSRLRRSLLVETLVLGPFVFTLRSWLRLLGLQKLPADMARRLADADGLMALEVRDWDRRPLYVRAVGTDWETAHVSLMLRVHRPPPELTRVTTILDLGANIGATVADLAASYPEATVLGIELDADNVALARRNVARWGDRASVVHGAVWASDGEIAYGGDRGEWAYRVVPAMDDRTEAPAIATVPAFSLTTLIDRLAPGGTVDYVKMDVEGAERFLLDADDGWSRRVRCLQVEVHLPLDVATCRDKLEALGFRAVPDPDGIPSVTAWAA